MTWPDGKTFTAFNMGPITPHTKRKQNTQNGQHKKKRRQENGNAIK